MKLPKKLLADSKLMTGEVFNTRTKINQLIDYLAERETKVDAILTNLRGGWTDAEIKKASFKWPQIGDTIFRFNSQGQIIEQKWTDSLKHRAIKKFLGVYKTKEQAREALLKLTDTH